MAINEDSKSGHSLSELNQNLKILDKLVLSEDKAKELNYRVEDGAMRWDGEKDIEEEIEFSDEQAEIIKKLLEKKNTDKTFTADNMALAYIAEQVGIKIE